MRWLGGAVPVALCCLALAGCGGSGSVGGSSPTPLPSSVSSRSAANTPTASSPSESSDPNTDAAVVKAVNAYVAAYQDVAREASIAPLSSVATSDCNCKAGLEELVGKLQAAHEHTDVTLIATDVHLLSRTGTLAKVSVVLTNNAYDVLRADGSVVGRAKAARNPSTINLRRTGAAWVVYLVS